MHAINLQQKATNRNGHGREWKTKSSTKSHFAVTRRMPLIVKVFPFVNSWINMEMDFANAKIPFYRKWCMEKSITYANWVRKENLPKSLSKKRREKFRWKVLIAAVPKKKSFNKVLFLLEWLEVELLFFS